MRDPLDLVRHQAALARTARALVRRPDDAEDAVQDAWVAGLEGGAALRARAPLAWLRAVVRRRAARARAAPVAAPLDAEAHAAPGPAPDATRARTEAAALLAAAVHRLPALDREVVVRRYWDDAPPRAIAAALGLDTRAVRNRLHRALRRLRDDLDGRVLALVAVPPPPPRHPLGGPALTLGAGAAATALTMPLKLGLGAALVAALALVLVRPPSGRAPAAAPVPTGSFAHTERPPEAAAPPLASPTRAPVAAGAPAPAGGASAPRADGAAAPVRAAGRVALVVVDGATALETTEFALRLGRTDAAGEVLRLVQLAGADLAAATFEAGRYIGLVHRPGYDPLDLGAFEVAPDRVTDLGRRRLEPGDAVLEGRVVGSAGPLVVELFGAGRRPGVCCEGAAAGGRCPVCGHAADHDEVRLTASAEFRFERLSAGPLDVVVKDAAGEVLATRPLELAPGEVRWLRIALGERDVEVVLTGPDGAPFDGVWLEDGEAFHAPLRFHGWAGDVLGASADVEAAAAGRRLTAQGPEGPLVVDPGGAPRAAPAEGRDAAASQRVLWPPALTRRPAVRTSAGSATRLAPGRYRLAGVPSELDAVQVACGPFVTGAVALSDEPGYGPVARITVASRCTIRSRTVLEVQGPVTCTSCHADPSAPR